MITIKLGNYKDYFLRIFINRLTIGDWRYRYSATPSLIWRVTSLIRRVSSLIQRFFSDSASYITNSAIQQVISLNQRAFSDLHQSSIVIRISDWIGTFIPTYPYFLYRKLILPNPDLQCIDSFSFHFFSTLTCEASSTISPFGHDVHLDSGTHNFLSFPGAPIVSPPSSCFVVSICHVEPNFKSMNCSFSPHPTLTWNNDPLQSQFGIFSILSGSTLDHTNILEERSTL